MCKCTCNAKEESSPMANAICYSLAGWITLIAFVTLMFNLIYKPSDHAQGLFVLGVLVATVIVVPVIIIGGYMLGVHKRYCRAKG